MESPKVREETEAVLAGVALDISSCTRLPTGEVLISPRDAVDMAAQLLNAVSKIEPAMKRFALIHRSETAFVTMLDGPLQGYTTSFATFFGNLPAFARMTCADIPGNFKYRSLNRTDDAGRWLYEFVARMKEGEELAESDR